MTSTLLHIHIPLCSALQEKESGNNFYIVNCDSMKKKIEEIKKEKKKKNRNQKIAYKHLLICTIIL